MNVILDIDETFVQYGNNDDWDIVPDADKSKYELVRPNKRGFFILRPHFDKFFEFLFKNCRTVNLWTLSDKEYAEGVASLIAKRGSALGKTWKIANIWVDTDNDEASDNYGGHKNITWIRFEHDHMFMPFNTVLVDDLPRNTQNKFNMRNGIQILPFDPLGHAKDRKDRTPGSMRKGPYHEMSSDDTLLKVIEKLKEVMEKPMFEDSTKINVSAGGKRKRLQKKTKRSKGLRRKTSRR